MGQSLAFARMFYLFNSYSFPFHYVFNKAQDKDLTLHVCAWLYITFKEVTGHQPQTWGKFTGFSKWLINTKKKISTGSYKICALRVMIWLLVDEKKLRLKLVLVGIFCNPMGRIIVIVVHFCKPFLLVATLRLWRSLITMQCLWPAWVEQITLA